MVDSRWLPGTLLGRLHETTRDRLLAIGVRRSVSASQVVLREGSADSFVLLLDDALAKVTATMTDGRQALLAIRMSGDIVGEIAALNGIPRTASVTICKPSTVRVIHRNDFRVFLRDNADVALALAGVMADRLRRANRRRIDFTSYPVKIRLARALCEIGGSYGQRESRGLVIGVRLTQAELASLCGAAEISVQKALRQLRDAGMVDTGYREIVIRDVDRLREMAEIEGEALL